MKKLFIVSLVLISSSLFAQQDPLFSQYMFNKLAVNPGYAGTHLALSADVINRWQWVGIDGAPKTLSASVHMPMRNPRLGIGFNIYNDKLGPSINQGGLATFAYKLIFPKSVLSFGLQAGIKYMDIDWSVIDVIDNEDISLIGLATKKVVPDANFGIYYYTKNYYVGLSSKQLLQNQMAVVNKEDKSQFTHLLRHFYGMAGAAFPITEGVVFRPSMLVKFVQNAPPQLDVNCSFLLANTIWVGASYRTEKAVSVMAELKVTKTIRIGYSYDMWFNALQEANRGSHEIRLGIDLESLTNRMLSPRYF
ncbi:MAG TPA: type IX secretion system membrane protein PorP/SprF [Bacteroidales bacterium]|nr:type IX secretion system membrane protein PorP/SprF [Bacteroidales bacterium]